MREHYDAVGKIASAAVASGDQIVHSFDETANDSDHIGLEVVRGDDRFTIFGRPTSQRFAISFVIDLAVGDRVPEDRLPHEHDAREQLQDLSTEVPPNFNVQTLQSRTDEGVDLFAGIQVYAHLYPYSEQFGLKDYSERLDQVAHIGWSVFNEATETLALEFNDPEPAARTSTGDQDRMFR